MSGGYFWPQNNDPARTEPTQTRRDLRSEPEEPKRRSPDIIGAPKERATGVEPATSSLGSETMRRAYRRVDAEETLMGQGFPVFCRSRNVPQNPRFDPKNPEPFRVDPTIREVNESWRAHRAAG